MVEDFIVRPNGLTLALDGKTLLLDDALGTTVYAYDVQADGSDRQQASLCPVARHRSGRGECRQRHGIDSAGRLYVATVRGVQVFDGRGRYLGTIGVPRQPSNLAFSGLDKRTLYITARQGLYRRRACCRKAPPDSENAAADEVD